MDPYAGSLESMAVSIDSWEAKIDTLPGAPSILSSHGMKARVYVMAGLAMLQAAAASSAIPGWTHARMRAILGSPNDANIAVDPRHSKELSDGLRMQCPALDNKRLNDVVRGAHLAVVAGTRQYDHWLRFLKRQGKHDGGQAQTQNVGKE